MANTNILQRSPVLSRLLNWLIQPKRIPLLFSVTVVAGILYHYAPLWTPVWILLSIVIQAGLFRLFDYMKQHMFIGSAAYLLCGLSRHHRKYRLTALQLGGLMDILDHFLYSA